MSNTSGPSRAAKISFLRSPMGHILTHRLPVLRRRLTGDTALLDFAVLKEFRALGGTDYVVFLVGFDRAGQKGVICYWLGDRAAGFADSEIMQLQRVTHQLSIALKAKIERNVAQNIAHAYLGKRAGQAVLNGLIRRGDGEKITAALWYSDLRHSTELADRLSAEAFLHLLGRYFEMTASSVLDYGGEVVSLIGDAVLGLFRFEGAPNEACGRALAAAQEARHDGIAFASSGIAIVKALVLGKFILVLHALKIGERKGGASVLLADILEKSVLFVVFLIALTVVEEIIVGYFHGRPNHEVLSEMAGGTLPQAFAVSILMLLILIPYFTFRVVADRLGEGALWKLLTERTQSR